MRGSRQTGRGYAAACRLALALACLVCLPAHAQSASDAPSQMQSPVRDGQAAGAFSRGTPPPAWAEPLPQLAAAPKGSERLVMLYADTHFRAGPGHSVLIHRVIQATQPDAVTELGQYSIPFQPEYQKVELHALRVLRGTQRTDRLADADIRFLQRETELEQGVVTGVVSALIVVSDLRAGDVLEISYSIVGQNPVFGGKFVDGASWDAAIPVRLRRVTLDTEENRRVHHRVVGGDAITPVELRSAGRKVLRFEEKDLPAVSVENHVPRGIHPQRWIQFSEFGSWHEVARWATELFAAPGEAADLGPALAEARRATDPVERLVRALAFVQSEVRYLSVAFGENSHRPYPPAQVLARRYGDCKDKSGLLVAVLRQLGIDARPALVSLQYRNHLDRLLPSPLAFDHVIVRATIGGRAYFIDPALTGQGSNMESIGQVHGGAQVLPVAPDSTAFETVLPQAPGFTRTLRAERATVDRLDGPVTLSVRFEHAGLDAESLRRAVARTPAPQLSKAYEGLLDRRYPGARLTAGPRFNDDRAANLITVDLEFQLTRLLERSDERWLVPFRADNLTQLFLAPDRAQRRFPLDVPGYLSVNRYEFEVRVPEEFAVTRAPEHRVITGPAFTMSETLSFSGRVRKIAIETRITAERVEPGQVTRFLEDLRSYGQVLGGSLILARSAPTSAAAPVPFPQAIDGRLKQIVAATSKRIAEARLRGEDAGDMLCERGRALAYLGRDAEALGDIQDAIRQRPASAELMKCSGEIHYVAGDFGRSTPALTRAIALGAADAEVYFFRGLSHYYLGRPGEAAKDFARAAETGEDASARLRSEIWRALALRAGSPAAEAPESGGAAGGSDRWQAAALALLRNRRGPDDVLREAHREAGDRLETALAEAYLYVGQYYLLSGEPLKARVFFQRSIAKGALHAFYHASARHELARLGENR